MKKLAIVSLLCLCMPFIACKELSKTIQLLVNNKTDKALIIEALYDVLPPVDKKLASMPNPFVYIDAPGATTTNVELARIGGGRLGTIQGIKIRTQDHSVYHALTTAEIQKNDTFTIVIKKDAQPIK